MPASWAGRCLRSSSAPTRASARCSPRSAPVTRAWTRRATFARLDGAMRAIEPAAPIAFAADYDTPIPYMQRTRDYYQLLGFSPYRWAHFVEVPFTPLTKPLGRTRVALITTAAPFQPGVGDQGPGAPYNAAAKFYQVYSMSTESVPDLRISHVGYDRLHT